MMAIDTFTPLRVVAISGSPNERSRSSRLLQALLEQFGDADVTQLRIDLARLPADDLLGRTRTPVIAAALEAVRDAHIVAVSTPVYRATYSGLLKVFFDLLPVNALDGKVGVALATGGSAAHQLVLDHGLRPLLASVGALVVPTLVYASDHQLTDLNLDDAIANRLARSAREAVATARALNTTAISLTGV